MTNRRVFLTKASVLTAGGILAANNHISAASVSSSKKNFGLQIYSLTVNREDQTFSNDVPAGLKKVAQMGYTSLELAGYSFQGNIGQIPMADFKKYADDAGLKIVSSHVGSAEGGQHTRNNLQAHLNHWK